MSIPELMEDLAFDGIGEMIEYLRNKAFIPYAVLANPTTYTPDMLVRVKWPVVPTSTLSSPSSGKKRTTMTLEQATAFLTVAREFMAASAPAPLTSAPIPAPAPPLTTTASEDVLRANQMHQLTKALSTLFPWMGATLETGGGKLRQRIGITDNVEIRKQLCDVTNWQGSSKGSMGSYDTKRQDIWDRLGKEDKELQEFLRYTPAFSVEGLPRIAAEALNKWFWEKFGELILLWLQGACYKTCNMVFTQESIFATIQAGQHRMKRHLEDKKPDPKKAQPSARPK